MYVYVCVCGGGGGRGVHALMGPVLKKKNSGWNTVLIPIETVASGNWSKACERERETARSKVLMALLSYHLIEMSSYSIEMSSDLIEMSSDLIEMF